MSPTTNDSLSPYPQRQLALCRTLSVVFSLLTFSIGFAALIGWLFDVDVLKRIHPSLVTMKANTSVCLMLVAVSVLLIRDPSASTLTFAGVYSMKLMSGEIWKLFIVTIAMVLNRSQASIGFRTIAA